MRPSSAFASWTEPSTVNLVIYRSTYAQATSDSRTGPVMTTTCLHSDPDHQWNAMHTQVNGGAMDGFVRSAAQSTLTDGHFALGYYDDSDLPFYYFLANTFALADRHFAP